MVKADDRRAKDNVPTVNMDWWNYGGITRDVLIAELDDTYIADYSISLDGNSTSRISGWIQLNNEIAGKDIILEIPELGISEKCITDSSGQAAFSVRAKPALWSPDNPKLYDIVLRYEDSDNGVNTLDDNMNEYVDIISFNQYVGWYRNTLEEARTMKWVIPYDKPVIISEFGGGAQAGLHGEVNARFTEEYQEELYIRNFEMLDKIDGLAGLSPWILMDFRSPRRQLPYIQDFYNRKGLISDWGLRKKAFFIVQEYYGEKKAGDAR